MEYVIQIVLLIVGFVMLVKGADWFVDGVAGIAEKFGIPQIVIGLTIVAMGTSAPEAAVSITSALKNTAENSTVGIAIGNVVGSNILNVLIILGITAVITNVAVQKNTIRYEIPFTILVTILFGVFGFTGAKIDRPEGIVFWVLFVLYISYTLVVALRGKKAATATVAADDGTEALGAEATNADDGIEADGADEKKKKPVWLLLILSVIGAVLVVKGADVSVDAATALAKLFGLSDRFIGLTIVALGTSLPELVTSATAALKGKADIAIGNIVGSNIFNILFVIGTTALIVNVPFAANFLIDTAVALASMFILWFGVLKTKELKRPVGILMLLAYAGYFVYLIQ
ncbi:MAG: calcium/sodium antiporter [Lachnospiraceae bacterium]|nr:calcium/sodium antiporter [Lachnospiraceae bacterium]